MGVCSCYHSQVWGSHSLPGPANPQACTELEFGNTMYSFSVACKSHFLNWIFIHKVLNKSLFFLMRVSHSRATLKITEMETCKKCYFISSHLSQSEKKVHRLENLSSSETSRAIYQVLVQIISVNVFSWLAMKMLI